VEKNWTEAIKKVLAESESPLHYSEISEQVLSRGYYQTDGATPAATVNAQISASIKHKGDKSPFIRIGKGVFTLKSLPIVTETTPKSTTVFKEDISGTVTAALEEGLSDSIIHSFGMYWQRDLVIWRNDPKMYGKQQALSKRVDFGKQKGIYILYDHHTVVYVGRSIDRPIGKRLYEHTLDRLSSRWNRFSWFGLLDVTEEGELKEPAFKITLASLVASLEALLIEALEPPQNRKRGDDFSAIEYIQDIDPELEERKIQNMLREFEQKMRNSL
jgi:hypothetical protein